MDEIFIEPYADSKNLFRLVIYRNDKKEVLTGEKTPFKVIVLTRPELENLRLKLLDVLNKR